MANLILTRQRGEKIIIGQKQVTITVVDIRGDKVRIGIEAPRNMTIHREEVYDSIERDGARKLTDPPSGP